MLGVSAWCVMTTVHELGHLIGGWATGATLVDADLWPWHLPYSIFDPDPQPLVTLWSGPILGAAAPVLGALFLRREWAWFIAYFCILANGMYITAGLYSGDSQLDTTKLLRNGAHPIAIWVYCGLTLLLGYTGLRRHCVRILNLGNVKNHGTLDHATDKV